MMSFSFFSFLCDGFLGLDWRWDIYWEKGGRQGLVCIYG